MNIENAANKIVPSFIDLVNLAKELMGGNQQPSVTEELGRLLGRLFPSTKGGERRDESRELLRVDVGESSASASDTNYTSFATRYTTKDDRRNMGIKSNIKETTEVYVA